MKKHELVKLTYENNALEPMHLNAGSTTPKANSGALLQTRKEHNSPSKRTPAPIALLLFLTATLTFSFEDAYSEESIGDRVANQSGDVSTNTKKAPRKARKKVRDGTGNQSTTQDIQDATNNAGDEVSNSAKKIKRKVN